MTTWNRKDLLGIQDLSAEEITTVLDTAAAFKQVGTREIKKVPALRGKTLVNFFVEPSTRTRTSFELAAFRLSADVINISASTSSLTKGETLKDTARNLEALHADIIVLRHSSAGAAQFLAERLESSVINAGDGAHEHPTQALLDAFTIREKRGRIAGLHVVIIGDILFSRVARSNIWALTKLGARVTLVGPSTLVPRVFEQLGARVTHDIDSALADADVVNLLRIQHERQRKEYFPSLGEYTSLFGLTRQRAEKLKPDAPHHAPRPDQSRRGNRQRNRRQRAQRHPRASHQRPRRPHGRPLPLRRGRKNHDMTPTLITNGHIIDPANGIDRVGDVYISGGKIAKVDLDGSLRKHPHDLDVIDASGLVVCPGLIDIHVHLREPGQSAKETIATGARAAAAGGFTTVVCMPNTSPAVDNASVVTWINDKARDEACVNVFPTGAITKGIAGEELAPIGSMHKAGIVALTDDGHCVQNHELMRRALEYARMFGLPVMDHCQDYNLVGKGVMHEGYWSAVLGLPGWPAAGEEVIVARNVLLAELCDTPIHCQHFSAAGSIRLAARGPRARRENLRRSLPAPHRAHRRVAPRLRHEFQNEPAAALAGRRRCAHRGHCRRHHHHARQRPRAALRVREGGRV